MTDPKAEEAVSLVRGALDSSHWPGSWAQAMDYLQRDPSRGSSAAAVLGVVKEGHERLIHSVTGLSLDQAMWKPSQDDWSVLETMHHVVAGRKGTSLECEALARGEVLGGSDAGEDFWRDFYENLMGPPYRSLTEARADAEHGNAEMVAFLNSVSAKTNIEKTHTHPAIGPMNCLGQALFQRAHDDIHMGQIAEIKASDDFPTHEAK